MNFHSSPQMKELSSKFNIYILPKRQKNGQKKTDNNGSLNLARSRG